MDRKQKKNLKKGHSKIPFSSNYETFIKFMRKGKFMIPYCKTCKKNIWPPTDYCTICFNLLELIDLKQQDGKLIDIFHSFVGKKEIKPNESKTRGVDIIGLVDFNGVKLLGSINKSTYNYFNNLKKYQNPNATGFFDYSQVRVKLQKCGILENSLFYKFKLVNIC